jgi:four helix bundle protein
MYNMIRQNILLKKSFDFSVRIVKLFNYLKNKKQFELAKQVLRSGTSIGANIEESIGAYSKKEFLTKIMIAYKEARETRYWINLLTSTNYIEPKLSTSLLADLEEICKILGKIVTTTKANLKVVH